ncbi:reverse transcriptase [Plakobranchus ocellatus]|uniref:Reverse transcriptase n=1 Tax=Plakobranchus ocellatus TaxID=259542 RepID=A0AAV4A444_9GAST|nr:reverse transcriptase [Plakobranchus ocellatus]
MEITKVILYRQRRARNSSEEDIFRSHSRDILEETTGLVWPTAPGIKFDSKPPSLQSAPRPNGVPYLLYKRCPTFSRSYTKYYEVHGKTLRSVKSG